MERYILDFLKIDPELIIFKFPIPLPKFGLLPVMIIVFGALAVALIPYKNVKSGTAWKMAFSKWGRNFLVSLMIPVALVMGAFFYFVLKDQLPSWARGIAESFGIAFTLTILGTPLQKLDGSIASILGLLIGIYLFYRYWKKNS